MRDDELRSLEREVATTGTGAARLAYARALERVGREDEAAEVLHAGRQSEEVRSELRARGVWAAHEASARYSAERAFQGTPRRRWRVSLEPPPDGFSVTGVSQIVAHPFGLACTFWNPACEARVLSLGTGRTRRRWNADPGRGNRLSAKPGRARAEVSVFPGERRGRARPAQHFGAPQVARI